MPSDNPNKKIEDLQVFENHLQSLLAQKQSFQVDLNSLNNALEEIKSAKDDEIYRVLSGVMIKSNKKKTLEFLSENKKMLEMKIESIEKQEKLLEKNVSKLKKEINESMSETKK